MKKIDKADKFNIRLMNNPKAKTIALLVLMSAICCGLLAVRIFISHDLIYGFLAWNLFLGLIPLAIAFRLYSIYENNKGRYFLLSFIGIVWLLFFPNAPYIITDFIHVKERAIIPIWYDIALVFSFACTSLLSGIVSLYFVHKVLNRIFSHQISLSMLIAIVILSGYGIFLGRIERWNSWDLVVRPIELLTSAVNNLTNELAIMITVLFSGLIGLAYLAFLAIINVKWDEKSE